jgi:hypothetical protein
MKRFIILSFLFASINAFAQPQSLDIITFTAPAGWEQRPSAAGIQFLKDDSASGAYCVITLYKSTPAEADAKENFKMAWTSLVKDMIQVAEMPEMTPSEPHDDYDVITGHANFEREGIKGVAILVNASGFGKMVNVVILANSVLYQKNISEFLESIHLSKPEVKAVSTGGYAFNTTNFDDGWTSTIQEDWVQVIKGTTRVLIHYPNKEAGGYMADAMEGLKKAWSVLVAPKYSSIGAVEYKPISGWEPLEMAEADAVENTTGQPVHIVLFKKNYYGGNGKYLECITPDKTLFVQEFGEYDANASNWEKLERLANYNKFAVAASDLTGTWTNNFTGTLQYVNAYTGLNAGMNSHASNQNFQFGPGSTYNWDLGVASGMVGNLKFQNAKSSGKFSMVNNWQIRFSDIEGKPKVYDVLFTCIKGARLLWIDGTAYVKKE